MPLDYAHEIVNVNNEDYCLGCLEDQPNQLAHIGGCLSESDEESEFREHYVNKYEVREHYVNKYEHGLSAELIDILENKHFVAAYIPIYFTDTKYPTSFIDYLIKNAKEDYDLNINCGDWVFTPYHVPHDIAREASQTFSWDHIYKMPIKYANRMNHIKGTSIRYGLPVGEEFVDPVKKQYYGHPALYDLSSKKTFDWSQSKKKCMKKLYEYNQLRLQHLEKSGLKFKSYKLRS